MSHLDMVHPGMVLGMALGKVVATVLAVMVQTAEESASKAHRTDRQWQGTVCHVHCKAAHRQIQSSMPSNHHHECSHSSLCSPCSYQCNTRHILAHLFGNQTGHGPLSRSGHHNSYTTAYHYDQE